METTSPDLSDDEIARICDPLTQPAAQIRYLRKLGLLVNKKPSGRPLVARAEYLRALVATPAGASGHGDAPAQPDHAALAAIFKRGRNGAKAQRQ